MGHVLERKVTSPVVQIPLPWPILEYANHFSFVAVVLHNRTPLSRNPIGVPLKLIRICRSRQRRFASSFSILEWQWIHSGLFRCSVLRNGSVVSFQRGRSLKQLRQYSNCFPIFNLLCYTKCKIKVKKNTPTIYFCCTKCNIWCKKKTKFRQLFFYNSP